MSILGLLGSILELSFSFLDRGIEVAVVTFTMPTVAENDYARKTAKRFDFLQIKVEVDDDYRDVTRNPNYRCRSD